MKLCTCCCTVQKYVLNFLTLFFTELKPLFFCDLSWFFSFLEFYSIFLQDYDVFKNNDFSSYLFSLQVNCLDSSFAFCLRFVAMSECNRKRKFVSACEEKWKGYITRELVLDAQSFAGDSVSGVLMHISQKLTTTMMNEFCKERFVVEFFTSFIN